MEKLVSFISESISNMNGSNGNGAANSLEYTRPVKSPKDAMQDEAASLEMRAKYENENSSDVVQQSQVSSSRSPSVLANDIIGPLLLEALDGFLFMVDSSGNIQFISENVTQYLKYTQDDLIGYSIYNLVHSEDHDFFTKCLALLSFDTLPKSRTFICRMCIKLPGEERHQSYDKMQITAILQPHPELKTERGNCFLLACIARRVGHVEKVALLGIEQFTTKQDLSGIILDTSGISPGSYAYSKLIGQNVQEFCHKNDKQQMLKHHTEVLNNGSNTSGVYRFRLQENRYVFVQTKSKLFKNPTNGRPEFIMSTHSIVRECDTDSELKGSASTSLMKAIIGQSNGRSRLLQSSFKNDSHDSSGPSRLFHGSSLPPKQSSSMLDINDLLLDSGISLDLVDDADDLAFSNIPDLPASSGSFGSLFESELSACTESVLTEAMTDTFPDDWTPSLSDNRITTMQGGGNFNRPESGLRLTKKERQQRILKKRMSVDEHRSSMMHNSPLYASRSSFEQQFSLASTPSPSGSDVFLSPRNAAGLHSANSWDMLYPVDMDSPQQQQQQQHNIRNVKFVDVGLIEHIRCSQEGSRSRNISGESSNFSSSLQVNSTVSSQKAKNAHLADLLLKEEDDDVKHDEEIGISVARSDASKDSFYADEKSSGQLSGNTAESKRQSNVILKKLLSQEEDAYGQPNDIKPEEHLLTIRQFPRTDKFVNELSPGSAVSSSALVNQLRLTSVSSTSVTAGNEAEPKESDNALLKELLNDTGIPAQASTTPAKLLKTLLSQDSLDDSPISSRESGKNSCSPNFEHQEASSSTKNLQDSTDVNNSSIFSDMEKPIKSEEKFAFKRESTPQAGSMRRKSDNAFDCLKELTESSQAKDLLSLAPSSSKSSLTKLIGGSSSERPSKKNVLLAQLLSRNTDGEPSAPTSCRNPSSIAVVTPMVHLFRNDKSLTDLMAASAASTDMKCISGSVTSNDNSQEQLKKNLEDTATIKFGNMSNNPKPSEEYGKHVECSDIKEISLSRLQHCSGGSIEKMDVGSKGQTSSTNFDTSLESFNDAPNINTRGVGETSGTKKAEENGVCLDDHIILAQLEQVLDSSNLSLEDLNLMLDVGGLNSGGIIQMNGDGQEKSPINALEEQLLKISSSLTSNRQQQQQQQHSGVTMGEMHAGNGNMAMKSGQVGDQMSGCTASISSELAEFGGLNNMDNHGMGSSQHVGNYQHNQQAHDNSQMLGINQDDGCNKQFSRMNPKWSNPGQQPRQAEPNEVAKTTSFPSDYSPISPAFQEDYLSSNDQNFAFKSKFGNISESNNSNNILRQPNDGLPSICPTNSNNQFDTSCSRFDPSNMQSNSYNPSGGHCNMVSNYSSMNNMERGLMYERKMQESSMQLKPSRSGQMTGDFSSTNWPSSRQGMNQMEMKSRQLLEMSRMSDSIGNGGRLNHRSSQMNMLHAGNMNPENSNHMSRGRANFPQASMNRSNMGQMLNGTPSEMNQMGYMGQMNHMNMGLINQPGMSRQMSQPDYPGQSGHYGLEQYSNNNMNCNLLNQVNVDQLASKQMSQHDGFNTRNFSAMNVNNPQSARQADMGRRHQGSFPQQQQYYPNTNPDAAAMMSARGRVSQHNMMSNPANHMSQSGLEMMNAGDRFGRSRMSRLHPQFASSAAPHMSDQQFCGDQASRQSGYLGSPMPHFADQSPLKRSLAPNIRQSMMSGGHAVMSSPFPGESLDTDRQPPQMKKLCVGLERNMSCPPQQSLPQQNSFDSACPSDDQQYGNYSGNLIDGPHMDANQSSTYLSAPYCQQPCDKDIRGVPSMQSSYSAEMKRNGICMEERSVLCRMLSPNLSLQQTGPFSSNLDMMSQHHMASHNPSVASPNDNPQPVFGHPGGMMDGMQQQMFSSSVGPSTRSSASENYQKQKMAKRNQLQAVVCQEKASTKEYVNQAIRNICTARSLSHQQVSPAAERNNSSMSVGELPQDILESISEMSKVRGEPASQPYSTYLDPKSSLESGLKMSNTIRELSFTDDDNEMFWRDLTSNDGQIPDLTEATMLIDDPLLSISNNTLHDSYLPPPSLNRNGMETLRSGDPSNSLLQQLLSDSTT